MESAQDTQLWYKTVVQPKLQTLSELASGPEDGDFPVKKFFKDFLADLEMMGLDNYTVEVYAEKITEGFVALQNPSLRDILNDLREVAMIALLTNGFDRILFQSYWRRYRPLMRKNKNLTDEAILNAYRLPMNVRSLIEYVSSSGLK